MMRRFRKGFYITAAFFFTHAFYSSQKEIPCNLLGPDFSKRSKKPLMRVSTISVELLFVSRSVCYFMGSVGDDYVCPWCGRRGNGGTAVDGVGYPICTDGHDSCLDALLHGGIHSMKDFRLRQLTWILRGTPLRLVFNVVQLLAEFLASWPMRGSCIEYTWKRWKRRGWRFASTERCSQLEEVRKFLAH